MFKRIGVTAKNAETAEILFRKFVYESANAFLEQLDVEVDQQSNVTAGKLKVGEYLGLVYGFKPGHSLEFNNDEVFDKQINAIATVDTHISINDRQGLLTLDAKPTFDKLELHAGFIGRFKQPWA